MNSTGKQPRADCDSTLSEFASEYQSAEEICIYWCVTIQTIHENPLKSTPDESTTCEYNDKNIIDQLEALGTTGFRLNDKDKAAIRGVVEPRNHLDDPLTADLRYDLTEAPVDKSDVFKTEDHPAGRDDARGVVGNVKTLLEGTRETRALIKKYEVDPAPKVAIGFWLGNLDKEKLQQPWATDFSLCAVYKKSKLPEEARDFHRHLEAYARALHQDAIFVEFRSGDDRPIGWLISFNHNAKTTEASHIDTENKRLGPTAKWRLRCLSHRTQETPWEEELLQVANAIRFDSQLDRGARDRHFEQHGNDGDGFGITLSGDGSDLLLSRAGSPIYVFDCFFQPEYAPETDGSFEHQRFGTTRRQAILLDPDQAHGITAIGS
jgi:hypothetical protein